jgi:hypothetical protein
MLILTVSDLIHLFAPHLVFAVRDVTGSSLREAIITLGWTGASRYRIKYHCRNNF